MSTILFGASASQNWPNRAELYDWFEFPITDSQTTVQWPSISSMLARNGVAYNQWNAQSTWFEAPMKYLAPGNQTRKVIRGITRDSSGNPLGNCTVNVFLTATNAFEITVTSASDGSFSAPVQTTGTYYCVAFLPGSPDTAGSTDNNLTGV